MKSLLHRAAALLLIGVAPASAQYTSASLDLSAARMRFADSIDAAALFVTPSVRVAGTRGALDASGTFSRLGDAWSNSGIVDASVVAATLGRVAAELGGLAGGSIHSGGTRTGQLLGSARLRIPVRSNGALWAGAGTGVTWDGEWRPISQLDLGGWAAANDNVFSLNVRPTAFDDSIRFTDALLAWSRDDAVWQLGATLGFRAGAQLPSLPANRNTWGSLGAALRVSPQAALVASVGTYPVDFMQGYPGGRYMAFGMRFRGATVSREDVAPAVARPSSAVHEFQARRIGEQVVLRVLAPRARHVELSADFTTWEAVALRGEGNGWWSISLPVARGAHELNVRIDGGAWLVPPGTVPVRDEFGTTTGRLVVR